MGIESIAVVGCGRMGLGIVETAARAGLPVTAIRASEGDPAAAAARFTEALAAKVSRGKLEPQESDAMLARVTFASSLAAVADADLVIESAAEDLALKRRLLPQLEQHMAVHAILATNTSSLPMATLSATLERPGQFLALHFFNPVAVMKLVEIAATDRTTASAVADVEGFCRRLDKTSVRVAPQAGYVVNRLLVPLLLHAIETLEGGVAGPGEIDAAMRLGCGHPMGPLALADLIGLDVVLTMAKTLQEELKDPRYRAPSLLRRLVLTGHLGKKSGSGIYDYRGAKGAVNPAIELAPLPMAATASGGQ